MRKILAVLATFASAGCMSKVDWSKEPLPVTVSAANYSKVSGVELYERVNAPRNSSPKPPENALPDKPLFYAFVPGEIYDSDVPVETVFRELAVPMAERGYFNIVYQMKAGLQPKRIDYLIRVHCGVRPWRKATVRTDKVTWGNDGLFADSVKNTIWRVGPASRFDVDREGLSIGDIDNLVTLLQASQGTKGAPYDSTSTALDDMGLSNASRDFSIVLLEAFRFDDVWHMKKKAPCIWATFIAVPMHPGQEFSKVLRTMVRKATPYFGETSNGLQEFDVPPGNVLMGEPVVVPGPEQAK